MSDPIETDILLTREEVAAILKVSPRTIERYTFLPSVKFPGKRRWLKAAILEYIRDHAA